MTDLVRDLDETSLKGMTASTDVWKDINQGAATMLVAAFDPKLSCKSIYLLILSCEGCRNNLLILCLQLRREFTWIIVN
jgi:hypothetical protein